MHNNFILRTIIILKQYLFSFQTLKLPMYKNLVQALA